MIIAAIDMYENLITGQKIPIFRVLSTLSHQLFCVSMDFRANLSQSILTNLNNL